MTKRIGSLLKRLGVGGAALAFGLGLGLAIIGGPNRLALAQNLGLNPQGCSLFYTGSSICQDGRGGLMTTTVGAGGATNAGKNCTIIYQADGGNSSVCTNVGDGGNDNAGDVGGLVDEYSSTSNALHVHHNGVTGGADVFDQPVCFYGAVGGGTAKWCWTVPGDGGVPCLTNTATGACVFDL